LTTPVPVNKKDEYMEALEAGRVHQDISIFTKFIASWQIGKTRNFNHPSPEYDKLFKHQITRPFALSIRIGLKWSSCSFFPWKAMTFGIH
jgi:hypothetical protein